MTDAFDALQARLGPALVANSPGSDIDHVMIVLPSYSVSESILSHYAARIPSLEHRYLNAIMVASRIDSCDLIYISTHRPDAPVIEYYLELVPAERRDSVRRRIELIGVDDGTPRSVAARMADRPDLIAHLRERVGDRPAFIEPWNVTENEVALAVALGVPINGTRPGLRALGHKSEGRRVIAEAGVPIPLGREDIRTVDDAVDAIRWIRSERPAAPGVVIKHDDSGAGDGNAVIDLAAMDDAADGDAWLRGRLAALPDWYLTDLALGGIVEERISGAQFSSPSAQVDVRPDGEVRVLSTHEQVLGGESGQVYLGCRFPAESIYAPRLAADAASIGEVLAKRGALGRFSVDFVAAGDDHGSWDLYAIEINLRKGGTTHPFAALRNAVPGRYDAATGRWIAQDGSTRVYASTDNLVDPAWLDLPPEAVIKAVADAGLQFDPATGTGTILHMLSGLSIDGRFGLTAFAMERNEADAMVDGVRTAVDALGTAAPT